MDARATTRALVLMAAVGFALAVYAVSTIAPTATPPVGSLTPLKAWITTDAVLYAEGDTVNVTVHIQNLASTEAILSVRCTSLAFLVQDLHGTPYYNFTTNRACPAVIRTLHLGPRAEANETHPWDQTTSNSLPLPRGSLYRVVPLIVIPGVAVLESDAAIIYLA